MNETFVILVLKGRNDECGATIRKCTSIKKSTSMKIMKKYVLNSWISFLHFPMHKDCIEND